MEQHEKERFDQLYAQHLQALKLQGKRGLLLLLDVPGGWYLL